jgi:hypothetical protein
MRDRIRPAFAPLWVTSCRWSWIGPEPGRAETVHEVLYAMGEENNDTEGRNKRGRQKVSQKTSEACVLSISILHRPSPSRS